jgi:hypothetical protein
MPADNSGILRQQEATINPHLSATIGLHIQLM